MDPLWLSLIAIIVVILSVLFLRLHPFLALSLGALVVAVFTPETQLFRNGLNSDSKRVTSFSTNQSQVVVSAGRAISGMNWVYRQSPETGLFESVGKANVAHDGDTTTAVADGELKIRTGDRLLHESNLPSIQTAARQSAGQRLATGFGETCRKIGILIAMASVIGMCLLKSGAASRIVDSTRAMVGEKNTPIAFSLSGFVVGIPVFFDTVFYLLMPLAKAMRLKTGKNYLLYVMSIVVGATMAHSLVPPTPGPLYVASEMDVSVGMMIMGGLVVGLIAVCSGYLYVLFANWYWEIPLRDDSGLNVSDAVAAEQTAPDLDTAPSLFVSLLPIVLPVLLLAGYTLLDARAGTLATAIPDWLSSTIRFAGDKNVALIISAVIALLMLASTQKRRGEKNWLGDVQGALSSGGLIILITAAGGAFGHVLRQCGVAEAIQQRFPSTENGPTLLLLAFGITAVVRFAQGSATVAMITSVGIVGPLAADLSLGYHPLYLALAIGCGSKPLPWMNDSGFWIVGKMSGMTEGETLKTFSVTLTIMGLVGFLVTLVGAKWLPLVGS